MVGPREMGDMDSARAFSSHLPISLPHGGFRKMERLGEDTEVRLPARSLTHGGVCHEASVRALISLSR